VTRVELVALFVALFVVSLAAMWLGWRNRARRQSALPELASAPTELGVDVVAPLTGVYVGSTTSTRWQDRIVAHGLGETAESVARLTEAGVLIERQASPSIFIPDGELIDARLEPALAGKVVGRGGLLVLRWQHGSFCLDTGIRADDRTQYPAWIKAIDARATGACHVTQPTKGDQ